MLFNAIGLCIVVTNSQPRCNRGQPASPFPITIGTGSHRFAKTGGSEGQAGENELKLYSLNTMRPDYAQAQLCKNKHVHFCSTSIKNYSSDSIAIF